MVRRGTVFDERPVIARDEHLDLALLTAPAGLEGTAVEIAEGKTDALPGDGIWAAGFPRGWDGPDPVVVPGTIAGLSDESWVNVDGIWGDSGGPLCRLLDGQKAVLAGIMLGNTKGVSKALKDWGKLFGETAGDSRLALEQLRTGNPALAKQTMAELRAPLKLETTAGRLDPSSAPAHIRLVAMMGALGNSALAGLIEDHFRPGFLRFAPVSGIRKLLELDGAALAT
jgi:hypothetical protein